MSRRRFLQACSAAAVVAVSAACADSSGGTAHPHATPRQGGDATMLIPGDASGLNPYTAKYSVQGDGNRLAALYDVLLWSDPATGTVRPQLAESLLPDREALVWTLTIRQGIVFTDGARLDAEAVKRAWEKHLDPKLKSASAGTVKPLTLTVLDEFRLTIKLPSPNANFDRTVAHSLNFIPSPRTLASDDAIAASDKAPVGAGPFKLREWIPGSHMTFERNPGYWQQGLPHLDTVTFRVDSQTANGAKTIASGDADITVTGDPLLLADARERKLSVGEIPLNGGLMVAFNTREKKPLADPRLRRAISLSLSTAEMDQLFFEAKGRPAQGIFDSSSPLANVQLVMPQDNPPEAAGLYAQVTDSGRKPLRIPFVVPDTPRSMPIAQYVKDRVERASGRSVTIEISPEPLPNYSQRVVINGDFDMATYSLWAEDPEPTLYQLLHSKSGVSNLTGYQNPEADRALEDARRSSDRFLRSEAYTRLQVQLINDIPFFVYAEVFSAYIADPRLAGLQLFNDGLLLWDRIGISQ